MIRDFFATNIWLKLISLSLAIALWLFVILSGITEIIISAPVTYINIPSDLKVLDSPKSVSVGIEGREKIIEKLKQNEIRAVIDLSGAEAGRTSFPLSKDNINLPGALLVTSIAPGAINLTIRERQEPENKVISSP
jgi:YbbR domain-containing protein